MRHGVLVVGLGAIGMGYDLADTRGDRVGTHARAFAEAAAFELLAGVDLDLSRQRTFEKVYGKPAYGVVEEALDKHQPQVIVIACPTPAHADTLTQVLRAAKPTAVLCEKPLAQDMFAANMMLRECTARGIGLYVNYTRRADPAVNSVKRMLAQEEILAPLKGVVWYSKGLIHNGSHFVDLLRYWLGPPHDARVMRAGRRWQGWDPEPDFTLEYPRGAVSFLAASEECFSHYTVEFVARNGRLRYERGGERVEWQAVIDDPDFAGYRVLAKEPQLLPSDMRRSQLNVANQLAMALEGKESTLCTGQQAVQTLADVYRVVELLNS